MEPYKSCVFCKKMAFNLQMISYRNFHRIFPNIFVPKHVEPDVYAVRHLFQALYQHSGRVIVLTGAGVSTESGIPDYRSEDVGRFARSVIKPIRFQEFIMSPLVRQRFWARNYVAYPHFSSIQPNIAHRTLAEWERKNVIFWLLTQNVDGLHQRAGSKKLTEMHGTMHEVHCLNCSWRTDRADFQRHALESNPDFLKDIKPEAIAPDGDVDLPKAKIHLFNTPHCPQCQHHTVMPIVVFFGDNLPEERRILIDDKIDRCDGLLIIGSTLNTRSAYRLAQRVYERKKLIAVINIGTTCADQLATIRIANSRCGRVLELLNDFFKDEYETSAAASFGTYIPTDPVAVIQSGQTIEEARRLTEK